jgi:hypothetical protein
MSNGVPYVLGHSEAELDRLARQARAVNPITQRFFSEAGVGPGMRVLDVGCGGGDVSVLVAGLVGPGGSVVGFDRSEAAVEAAVAKINGLACGNVTFVSGSLDRLVDQGPFDAIVGRYVLQFVDDPAMFVGSLAALAKPGAPIVFHELDWSGVTSDPPVPTYDRLARRLEEVIERSGAATHSGMRLPSVFVGAGLGYPEMRIEQRAGAGSTAVDVVERMVGLARTLAESMVESEVADRDELDLPTLHEKIMAEVMAAGSVLCSHLQVGAWCRNR